MPSKCMMLLSLLLVLFACLPAEDSYVRGAYDSVNLLNAKSAYHTHPYQCLVALNGEVDPDSSSIINAGGNGNDALCLPSNELTYLIKAKKPIQTTDPSLKIAVLFDSSYSLQKTDKSQLRFSALKSYLLGLFDNVQDGEINARAVEVSFFPFKYCSHADFATKLTITKGDDKNAFEGRIDAVIGAGSGGNSSKNAASKLAKLKNGELTPSTLKEYGAYGSTNYLQAFDKARKHLSTGNSGKTYKHIVIFSDGLPLTFNDGKIDTYNDEACNLPASITAVTADNWNKADGYKKCVLEDLFYPSAEKGECIAPTSKDAGITKGFKAYSDPMNHLLGMIQHSDQISQAAQEDKDLSVYAIHLKVCAGLPAGEKHLCQSISKPFFTSFVGDGRYFPAGDANKVAESFNKLLQEQSKQDYVAEGSVKLDSADDKCEVSVSSRTVKGISTKYKESDDFSFLKAHRAIKVGAYKGKAKGKDVGFVKLSANKVVNLGLPHAKGRSLTAIKHSAGQSGDKHFKVCSNFTYADSCVTKNPTELKQNKSLEVHEYTDAHSNKIYCVLPKPVTVDVVVTPTIEPLPEPVQPTIVVEEDNTGGVTDVTVTDVDENENPGGSTNTGVIDVTPVVQPPTKPQPQPPTAQDKPPKQDIKPPSTTQVTTNNPGGNNVGQTNPNQKSGAGGVPVPASGIKIDVISNWYVGY